MPPVGTVITTSKKRDGSRPRQPEQTVGTEVRQFLRDGTSRTHRRAMADHRSRSRAVLTPRGTVSHCLLYTSPSPRD